MVDSTDEVVIDNARTRDARVYNWLLNHLAKFPGRVTALTFAAGAAVTLTVTIIDADWTTTTIVSLLATLWALFFSVMIYLLTARDTDRVLEQIADLHDQLSTALAAPDEVEEEEEQPESKSPVPVPAAPDRTAPDRTAPDQGGPDQGGPDQGGPDQESTSGRHRRPGAGGPGRPTVLTGTDAITSGVPADLVKAWATSTGRDAGDLSRAWSRDPRSDRQWVLETAEQERWVVFSKHGGEVGVMSLDRRPNVGPRYARSGDRGPRFDG